ncbi:Ulp1 family isopeptidase (plasmid) [Rhizobium sp. T1470]|uniref:Ulp1 family isopeptidase n=1 Tax=Rhizobium sp. T1470 TaxID=555320 RepID=UPI001AAF3BD1|nr:Ulp1 family isopeptidase [Rhizobium sp. T1473]MCA0804263.1 C48 family peptidase [Rhizobium sp. T1473]
MDLDSNSMQGGLLMLELYRQFQRANNSQDAGEIQPFQWQLVTPQSQIGPSSDDPQQNWHEQEIIKQFGSPFTPDYDSTQNELPPPPADNNPRFVPNPRWTPAHLPDLGDAVGPGWRHYSEFAPDALTNALRERGLMPAWNERTSFLINRRFYRAELRDNGRLYLTFQFGAWLGDKEWLWEDNIRRNFNLISLELLNNYPGLAAITALADPSQVPMLLGTAPDTGRRPMVRNLYGHDNAADFVFIPVSNAEGDDPDRRGTHWSLLLLDRRQRQSPMAYHFDSLNGLNNPSARRIARALGAPEAIQMAMTQQDNGRDCGIFLLEAARALIGELAQGRPPIIVRDLPGDRGAVQARLRDPRGDNP